MKPARTGTNDGTAPGSGRVKAFSDAVFAIIITLLVLDLRPPEHEAGELWTALAERWPAYVAFGLSVLLFLGASRLRVRRLVRFTSLLVFVEVLQIKIGITQARLGLPEVLVAIHMVLACALAAAMTAVLLSLRGQSRIVVEQSAAAQPTS